MTEQQNNPSTTSQIGGIRAHTNFQAIDATFFNLTDTDGRAIAGLMLLLDRMNRPVRAELHFYEEVEGFLRDNTIRQAQAILQERYYSHEPVTLRVMYVFQDRNSYDVTLPEPSKMTDQAPAAKKSPWKMIAAIAVAIVLVIAIGWAVSRMLDSGSDAQVAAEAPNQETPTDGEAIDETPAETQESAASADAAPTQASNLPESTNARSDLAVGMRASILPGLQSFIRTEPDAVNGENMAVFQDGDSGLLVDGPVMKPGTSDTIVWWRILSDDGVEGWVPANTSQFTLLVPEE